MDGFRQYFPLNLPFLAVLEDPHSAFSSMAMLSFVVAAPTSCASRHLMSEFPFSRHHSHPSLQTLPQPARLAHFAAFKQDALDHWLSFDEADAANMEVDS